jgi:hypothetical protein
MAAADPQVRIATLEAALRVASRELHWANLTIQKRDAEIQLLEERLRKQRIGFLGPGSETLSNLQLELLDRRRARRNARRSRSRIAARADIDGAAA